MLDLHEFVKDGAEANLRIEGQVSPIFFGQAESGVYASPSGDFTTTKEKEDMFHSRMLALKAFGVTEITLVIDTFYTADPKTLDNGDFLMPSQDPDSKDAILVHSSKGTISMLPYGRNDDGSLHIEDWIEMPADAEFESWLSELMEYVLALPPAPEADAETLSTLVGVVLGAEVYKLGGV